MSKAVLISIRPEWCEKIANGAKTIEVRKTYPKLKTPFKCYIYCTKPRFEHEDHIVIPEAGRAFYAGGKVIGEFVCSDIYHYKSEFWDDETFERIQEEYEPSDFNEYGEYEYATIAENGEENWLCKKSCLSWGELRKYVGAGIRDFYGWQISDLVIYDKPKALDEFNSWTETRFGVRHDPITRPPQSWCYVEEVAEDEG